MRPERPDSSRGAYLDAMAEHTTSFMGAANPAASRGLLGLDPFEVEACSIRRRDDAAGWRRVPTARGYACLPRAACRMRFDCANTGALKPPTPGG